MIKKEQILYSELISPNCGENLWHVKSVIENSYVEKLSFFELKKLTVFYLEKMINDEIIEFDFAFNEKDVKSEEVITKIKKYWVEGTEYIELYTMVWFSYQQWYKMKLRKIGLTETSDWKTFVEEKIGNLEHWIEENRPKS